MKKTENNGNGNGSLLHLTDEDRAIVREMLKGATEIDIARFFRICERTGLDPITKQVYGRVQRERVKGRNGNPDTYEPRLVVITSIDGFRSISERTGEYRGQTKAEWFCKGPDSTYGWHDICVPKRDQKNNAIDLPEACRVGIYREGFVEPCYGYANFDSFASYQKDNGGNWYLGTFWNKMPEHMIAKVAEAQAHRKAFPLLLGGLYIEEEVVEEDISEEERNEAAAAARHNVEEPVGTPVAPVAKPARTRQPKAQTEAPKPDPTPAPAQETKPVPAPSPTPAPVSEDNAPGGQPEPAVEHENSDQAYPWVDYVIDGNGLTHAKFKGRKVGDLSVAELELLNTNWCVKFKDDIDKYEAKRRDRDMLVAALEYRRKEAQG